MIHTAANFILGAAATIGTIFSLENIDPETFGSIDELIKYIVSLVGGVIATIIINLLKKKFPDLFTRKYRQKDS